MKKVVFIMGIGRSGSTLLDLMLGSHSDAFSLGEISKLPSQVEEGKRNFCLLPDSTFWPDSFTEQEIKKLGLGLSGHRLNKYIPLQVERIVREIIGKDDIFNSYDLLFSKIPQTILIDSSKYVSHITNQLKATEFKKGLIDAYLLYMIRDGRAVINSYSRVYPDRTIEALSQKWVKNFQEQQNFYEQFKENNKKIVRYEELASNPEQVIKNICEMLAIEFEPDMINFWKHEHHHIVGSRGTNSQILKYRNSLNQQKNTNQSSEDYYGNLDFKIKLDLRWKKELSSEKLEIFNQIAGNLNKPYEWN